MMSSNASLLKRYLLVAFFTLVFAITWIFSSLSDFAEAKGWITLPTWAKVLEVKTT